MNGLVLEFETLGRVPGREVHPRGGKGYHRQNPSTTGWVPGWPRFLFLVPKNNVILECFAGSQEPVDRTQEQSHGREGLDFKSFLFTGLRRD